MDTLSSVNVVLPQAIIWNNRTVYAGAWKTPVDGPRIVRRLNIEGDGQGDLGGHGTLLELEIDPPALSDYTNTALEEIITEVLQKTRTHLHVQVMELFEICMAPGHARFDPNVLGKPYVDLPG